MEEEREEERERQELKRRNYQLVVERAGRRRGSNDRVEDQVSRMKSRIRIGASQNQDENVIPAAERG